MQWKNTVFPFFSLVCECMIVNYRDLVVVVVVGVAVDINILSQQLESDFIKTGRYLSEE